MDVADWIKEARQKAKLTQEQLGERLGLTKGNISSWEHRRHSPSIEQLTRIAGLTGVNLALTGINLGKEVVAGSLTVTTPDGTEFAGYVGKARRIPVVGTAKMGDDGFYEEMSSVVGAGDGHIEIATEDPNAYGLRVRGQSMFPAIRDGWYVLVEPNGNPREGEYVLLKLLDGRRMVKEFMYRRPGAVELMSVNGGERLVFDTAEIEDMQAVGAVVSPSKWRPD